MMLHNDCSKQFEPRYEKTGFCICENKDAAVTAKLISAFVFAT